MENIEEILLTEEGKNEKEKELRHLEMEVLPEIVQRIKVAREQGDLSENAEYKFAKEEQGRVNSQINELKAILKYAKIIQKPSQKDEVGLGSTVTYLDIEENQEYTFTIVGTTESNIASNKISNESPVGKTLLGKKVNQECEVNTPEGVSYKIKIIEINS